MTFSPCPNRNMIERK